MGHLTAVAAAAITILAGTATAVADHGSKRTVTLVVENDTPSIAEIAAGADDLNTLVAALDAADLVDTLAGKGPFTVFAPTDAAFAKLDQVALRNTLENHNRARLTDVLTYHVVPGRITAADLANRRTLTTVNGTRLTINPAGGLKVNDARITFADVQANNGLIHIVDTVLIPTKLNLAETASEAGAFGTLLAAAKAAGLAEALAADDTEFTVFAPTDEAFAKLGDDAINDLLKPENRDTLRRILAFHVVEGRVYADQLLAGAEATRLEGSTLRLSTNNGVRVGNANIVKTDIDATNGVIHVIDAVLIPSDIANQSAATDPSNSPVESVLNLAIERGVPLFNAGNPAACAAVYEVAAAALLSSENITDPEAAVLTRALRAADRDDNATDRAWTLRRAFDAILTGRANETRRMSRRGH